MNDHDNDTLTDEVQRMLGNSNGATVLSDILA